MKKIFLPLFILSAVLWADQLHAFSAEFEKYGDVKFINPSEDSKAIKEFKYGETVRIEWKNIISDTSWQYSLINKETGESVYWGKIEMGETTLDFSMLQDPGLYYFNFNGKAAGDDSPVFRITSEKLVSIEQVSVTTEEPINIAAYLSTINWELSSPANFSIWATCSQNITIVSELSSGESQNHSCFTDDQTTVYRGKDITGDSVTFKVWAEDKDITVKYQLYAIQDGSVIDNLDKVIVYKPRKLSYPEYTVPVPDKPKPVIEVVQEVVPKMNVLEETVNIPTPSITDASNTQTEGDKLRDDKVSDKDAVRIESNENERVEANMEEKSIYKVTDKKEVKLFGIFKKKMTIESEVNGATGEVLKVKKPWWSFIAF